MSQSNFGAGFLYGTTAAGQPRMFAALQDVSVDFSFDMKQLYGSNQFAIEQARGKGKIEAKASMGRVDPLLFNDLFFGQTASAGELLGSVLESGTVPAATTYTVTVANSANFSRDLGVYDVATGRFMTKVSSGPATGEYSVAAGVYTFAAADASKVVKISYTYTSTVAGSKTVTGTNLAMGSGPIFRLDLLNSFRSKTLTLTLNAVQSSKLSMPLKLDDFLLPSMDFSAQDDGSGGVFSYTVTG